MSLCNTCKKADVSCPIYPQKTTKCVEYVQAGLLPCPFCAKADQLQYINVAKLAYMQCMFCGAAGAMWNITPSTPEADPFNKAQAKRFWNMRMLKG